MSTQNRFTPLFIMAFGAFAALEPLPAFAQCGQRKIVASDAASGNIFGYSVSVQGDRMLVGSHGSDEAGDASGSAYIFHRDDRGTPGNASDDLWIEDVELHASDAGPGEWFGHAVATDGNLAVIAAPRDDVSGAVYVFRWNGTGWMEEDVLFPSDSGLIDNFGWSVAAQGDTIIAGQPFGSAYVFRRVNGAWIEEAKLLPSEVDESNHDGFRFGIAVAIDGDRVVVGAQAGNDLCPGSPACPTGTAYVFRRDGVNWVEEALLTASDGDSRDNFGNAVAISSDRLLIGATLHQGECPLGADCVGAAYVFRLEGGSWVEEAKLTAPLDEPGHSFGRSVDIESGRAIVGSMASVTGYFEGGAAYLFRQVGGSWLQALRLTAFDPNTQNWFGFSVSLSGDTLAVGSYRSEGAAGSVYMHDLADCLSTPIPTPIPTASSWGIVALAVLLGVVGALLTRRADGHARQR